MQVIKGNASNCAVMGIMLEAKFPHCLDISYYLLHGLDIGEYEVALLGTLHYQKCIT
eukprot:c45630_g1_i1 orf=11-181(-)